MAFDGSNSGIAAFRPSVVAVSTPAGGGMTCALSITSATCLLDLEGVIIDGSFDRALLDQLLAQVERALECYSWEGIARPQVLGGTVGSDARAVGGAFLPLYAHFAPDRDLFLK